MYVGLEAIEIEFNLHGACVECGRYRKRVLGYRIGKYEFSIAP